MKNRQIGICVYGASSNAIDPSYIEAGEALGKGIADHGWRLVFGAGATGMMGAAVRGVKSEGGIAAGIAPDFFNQPGVLFDQLDDLLFTRTMRERKAFMESLADAFVVTPGGIGTLEEFYEILTLKQLGQLSKPLLILNTNGYYDALLEAMRKMQDAGFITESTMELFSVVSTVEEALRWLEGKLA